MGDGPVLLCLVCQLLGAEFFTVGVLLVQRRRLVSRWLEVLS